MLTTAPTTLAGVAALLDYLNIEDTNPELTLLSGTMQSAYEEGDAAMECLSMLATTIRRLAKQANA